MNGASILLLFLSFLFLASPLSGQQAAPPRCEAPEHREFDFWVGRWRVESPTGQHLGNSVIDSILSGCVLHEQWSGARGLKGESFSVWDRLSKRWHQSWVDSSGSLLLIDGAREGESIRMEGEGKRPDGTRVRNRITWTPLANKDCSGCVRQLWEQAVGDGEWAVSFEGIYKPEPGS